MVLKKPTILSEQFLKDKIFHKKYLHLTTIFKKLPLDDDQKQNGRK